MVVEVVNSAADEDNHYVQFHGNGELDGEGVWEECAKPGRKHRLDAFTMPLVLIRTSDGNFRINCLTGTNYHNDSDFVENLSSFYIGGNLISYTNHPYNIGDLIRVEKTSGTGSVPSGYYTVKGGQFFSSSAFYIDVPGNTGNFTVKIAPAFQLPKWEDALVGDDVTNPEPSFIGKPINKMLFFRNRLALLSEENIILSRPGDFFNFFATSAIQFIPSDPIDISASSTYPATLYDGIQVNAGLILFTKNQQFMLTTDSDILSVQTVKINSISTYNFNTATNPISLGTTIGFLDNANKHSRFFEMASALREGEPEIIEQSAVVSRLFDNDLKLISNSRENSAIFFSEGDSNTLYGYKYFDQINDRKLASWFKWTVEGTIKYHCMQDDNLFAVIKTNNIDATGTKNTLLRYPLQREEDLSYDPLLINDDYPVHLDYAISVRLTPNTYSHDYNSELNRTFLTWDHSTSNTMPPEIANHPLLGTSESNTKLYVFNPNVAANPGQFGKAWKTVNGDNHILWIAGVNHVESFILGTPYTMKVDIPTLYYQKQSGERWISDTRADTILHRVKLGFGPVGNYKTSLKCTGKADFDQDITIEKEHVIGGNYKIGILDDNNLTTIPIYNRNINTSLTIESTHPTPMTLHHLTWEGSYTDKNYSRV